MVNKQEQQPERGVMPRYSDPFEITVWITLLGNPSRQAEVLRVGHSRISRKEENHESQLWP